MAPKQIEFGYNALGQFTSIARYDFVGVGPMTDIATAALSYDAANRMTNLAYTAQGGGISIDAFSFALDNADRITSRTSTVDGTVDYGYDVTNQVTSAAYTGTGQPANEAYSYTKNGNRTNTGYSTGTNNQLLSDGTFNYSYDGEGNRAIRTRISGAYATDYKTVYGWDYRDRLTDVSYYDNNGVLTKHVHYVYDTLDHEIGKQVDDTGGGSYDRSEWYVLDTTPPLPLGEGRGEGGVQANLPSTKLADPLLQLDKNGNPTYRYLNGPTPAGVDAVMGEEGITTPGQAGTEYWPLGDQVNTPHETVNNASTTVDHVITNTFGVVTGESNPSIHHWAGFEGGHFDPDSVLTNDDHRWYDPVVGRWMSEDPIGFGGGDANVSRYVANAPTDCADPIGEASPNGGPTAPISKLIGSFDGHDIYTPVNIGNFVQYSTSTPKSITPITDNFPGELDTPINTGVEEVYTPTTPKQAFAPQPSPSWPDKFKTPINLGGPTKYNTLTPINYGQASIKKLVNTPMNIGDPNAISKILAGLQDDEKWWIPVEMELKGGKPPHT